MFLSTDAGFSLFFVIKIILMSFFCQLQNTSISHGFVTNYEKFLPDFESKSPDTGHTFAAQIARANK